MSIFTLSRSGPDRGERYAAHRVERYAVHRVEKPPRHVGKTSPRHVGKMSPRRVGKTSLSASSRNAGSAPEEWRPSRCQEHGAVMLVSSLAGSWCRTLRILDVVLTGSQASYSAVMSAPPCAPLNPRVGRRPHAPNA
ncbi:uncharacterized protein SCHCODRAFT_02045603 [Schizophyllum commune H4-8]|uniref:uncharacterized protein n=1 Tax=Schizophyllum commune (strain H4-8 / FGSC 9210) TaxID=578458 RepID=UPI002160A686|nr:uncharacterized protein SCHCODRAFT_02045603 [Schizophyllum commune H4-8]KAI5900868.1 hypothetical protein SCHCODRAFT_02045603 [Schizophyllum commune H4-8]